MLILSKAKVTVGEAGDVRVEGAWERYRIIIERLLTELRLERVTIRYRSRRFIFSRNVDPAMQQRLRNFFVNQCPVRE